MESIRLCRYVNGELRSSELCNEWLWLFVTSGGGGGCPVLTAHALTPLAHTPNTLQVSCGEAFSVALSEDGHLYTTGSSEFGQLGNGDTGEYIVAAGKIGFANCNIFTRRNVFCHVPGETHASMSSGNDAKVVPMNEPIRIGYIACGKHHSVAIEAPSNVAPRVWTWGCGNYGCLGHGVQQDEYHPRLVATLSAGPLWTTNPPVSAAAGSSCSMILTERGHVYYCGRHRSVGEAAMRPTLLEALANNGHIVTNMAAGSATVVCSTANAVTVSWGMGTYLEKLCSCCQCNFLQMSHFFALPYSQAHMESWDMVKRSRRPSQISFLNLTVVAFATWLVGRALPSLQLLKRMQMTKRPFNSCQSSTLRLRQHWRGSE